MPKRIDCNECKGKGHITLTRMFNDYCGIGCEPCEACGGKGYFEVPNTNADRIRAMSDEELANSFYALYNKLCSGAMNDLSDLFCDGQAGCITKSGAVRCSEKKEKSCVLRWLQSPAEEG